MKCKLGFMQGFKGIIAHAMLPYSLHNYSIRVPQIRAYFGAYFRVVYELKQLEQGVGAPRYRP